MTGFIFRTDGAWGAGKGANLTAEEFDGNTYETQQRLEAIETSPPTAVEISNIVVTGSQVQFNMSDGSHFGPFQLPIATFQIRNEGWVNGATYNELDLIPVEGRGLYLVRITHTTPALPATFDPNADDGSGHPLYLLVFGENTFKQDLPFTVPDKPGTGISAGDDMVQHVFAHATTMLATLPESLARLKVDPAADLDFDLRKNYTTSIGTMSFAAGNLEATFTFTDDVVFDVGDVFSIGRPSSIDTDAKQLSMNFVVTRNAVV